MSIYAPLLGSALGVLSAVAGVVEAESLHALVADSRNEVGGLAVYVCSHAGTEAKRLTLLAASEGRAQLQALPFPHGVTFILTRETVAIEWVIFIALGRDVHAEDAII